MPEDVLDHDYRCIDDQPEIDGADREQICRLAAQRHDRNRKKPCERDRRRDDDGRAQIAEENPLHEKDQHDTEDHVVQHSARGDVDQLPAVVDLLDLYTWRQNAGRVDLLDLRLYAADGGQALLAAAHQDDALDNVLVLALSAAPDTPLVARDHPGR